MKQAEAAPLVVTSPPLAREAMRLLRRHHPDGPLLVWQQGSEPHRRRALSKRLLSMETPLCISFYNDYIFSRKEIAAFPCLVNIHPALPSLRGRGYDTLPILEQHDRYGATLHFVSEDIDAGRIIEVVARPMPQPITYPAFRRMTQKLSLEMLETLLRRGNQRDLATLANELSHQALQTAWQWSGERLTSQGLASRLRNTGLRQRQQALL